MIIKAMKRETRLNLIFLIVLLAILTPGAVLLFRKKLQPTLKPYTREVLLLPFRP